MNWIFNIIKNLFLMEVNNKWHNKYVPGLQKSPTDYRDINVKDILGEIKLVPLPETYHIPYILPIKDQKSTPTCVGWSCASIKDEKERREKNDAEFDGAWIYNRCKEIDGYSGRGTYFRTGLKILQTLGAKPLATSKVQGIPATFRIGGYGKVDCDIESLKRAIIQFGCVLVGFYIYPNSWNSAYIKKGTTIVGGHAVVIIGWTKTHIIIQDSFGENAGNKGYRYFDQNYLPFEAWAVLSDVPTQLLPDENTKPKVLFTKHMYQGLNNDDVVALQDCLKFLGCMEKTQESTGYFGGITLRAVKIFQARYGIKTTGYVGPLTLDKLNKIFSKAEQ